VPKLPLLREDQDALSVLVRRAADHLGILDTFVEKDFWVTELLRAVAPGWVIDGQHVSAVFKGGTSLSRVYRLTERFSEDVDILLVYPDDLSPGPRDQALKGIAERARTHLGLDIDQAVSSSATRGVKRNVSYYYPRRFTSPAVREHLLLEMGSRGGPNPHLPGTVTSMVAEYARDVLGEAPETWQEWEPVQVAVLSAERTLLEKCALLHDLAVRISEGDGDALSKMHTAGRHYYDLGCLMNSPQVRTELAAMGTAGVVALTADIDERSSGAGWSFRARPAGGFATSPAFDVSAACHAAAASWYATAMAMVHGNRPSLDDCLATITANPHLL